ncbi:hypothetical protein A2U01_0005171, partial [Trifolium medium]|nr:hypothetical protein [Trifolium medium]
IMEKNVKHVTAGGEVPATSNVFSPENDYEERKPSWRGSRRSSGDFRGNISLICASLDNFVGDISLICASLVCNG